MKKMLFAAICLLPMGLMAQQAFTIKGKVGSLNAPAKAYLAYRVGGNLVTDSAVLHNGAFEFKGNLETALLGSIRVKHDATPVDPKKRVPVDAIQVYLEQATINVTAKDSVKYAKITGSKLNDANAKLKAALKPVNDKVDVLMKEYNSYTAEQKKDDVFLKPFMTRYDALDEEKKPIYRKFAQENVNSIVGFSAFISAIGYDIDAKTAEPEFMKFPETIRNSQDGKRIWEAIEGAKKSAIGVTTDFTQNDPDGKPVKLSDFKGKYVLVDFWASWCGPCRQENPNVVAAFNKYKDKNFTILGVSLDGGTTRTTKEAWLKAVKDDGLTWTHVSDLKGWDNVVSKNYGIQGIPFNFLVDPNGKIVARNITGEGLHTKLAELLGGGKTK